MPHLKPLILLLYDQDNGTKGLVPAIRAALSADFSVAYVASKSSAGTLLRNLIPDCVILDLASADAISVLELVGNLKYRPSVLAFVMPELSAQFIPGIEIHPNASLNDPSALRKIVAKAAASPHSKQGSRN